MEKYTLSQRKKIIFTFITQRIKAGKPVEDWLTKLARDGYSTWDLGYILGHIERYYIHTGGYNAEEVQEVIEFEILKETN